MVVIFKKNRLKSHCLSENCLYSEKKLFRRKQINQVIICLNIIFLLFLVEPILSNIWINKFVLCPFNFYFWNFLRRLFVTTLITNLMYSSIKLNGVFYWKLGQTTYRVQYEDKRKQTNNKNNNNKRILILHQVISLMLFLY